MGQPNGGDDDGDRKDRDERRPKTVAGGPRPEYAAEAHHQQHNVRDDNAKKERISL